MKKTMLRAVAILGCLFSSALLPPSAIAAGLGDGGGRDDDKDRCPADIPSAILDFTITDNAVIDLLARTVTISGTLACTAGVRYVRRDCEPSSRETATVTVLASQRWGNHEASNVPAGSVGVLAGACTDGTPVGWSITVVSSTADHFKPGTDANIEAIVDAFLQSGEAEETLTFHPRTP